ncbi:MAG: hypothetical protein RLZZ543_2056 [Bacteroidota bacterium]|jgi:DNA-binding CsgD family transcriptional regulator
MVQTMRVLRNLLLFISVFVFSLPTKAGKARPFLEKGWAALVKDNDAEALRYFGEALIEAQKEQNQAEIGTAYLHLGICSYSVSYSKGLEYAHAALNAFASLEDSDAETALVGRSRCLQLISTIYMRQGKFRDAIGLSKEAQLGFKAGQDSTGTLGLIYATLGGAYKALGKSDSTEFYYRSALKEQQLEQNETYLPGAYLKVAELKMAKGRALESQDLQEKAHEIAFRTGNRQAQVLVLLEEYKWFVKFSKDEQQANSKLDLAGMIALGLNDKSFLLRCLQVKADQQKEKGDFEKALALEKEMQSIRDTLYSRDKEETVKRLEVEFDVSEKERALRLLQQENDISQLHKKLLWLSIGCVLLIAIAVILFLRNINRRNVQLLHANEALLRAEAEQKRLREQQQQQELELKESQISALALQMLQKNELLQEMKVQYGEHNDIQGIKQLIERSLNQDKEWQDFNARFENLNNHFYTRLKEAYPEISPNDLKLCALIRLNLSIKEMAGILNISPDSVKTARYRLRKKLRMNTEDNLTEFILQL